MKRALLSLALCLFVLTAAGPARAAASAFVSVGGTPLVLDETGFDFQGGLVSVQLAPGESRDFTFDYTITVHDDGQPAPLDPAFFGCLPLHLLMCAPPYTGHEFAQAIFDVGYRDGRTANIFVDLVSDVPTQVRLATTADSFAEHLTQSGTIHLTAINASPTPQRESFLVFTSAWVLTSPIPEPAAALQLLAGLALVALVRPMLARRARSPRPS